MSLFLFFSLVYTFHSSYNIHVKCQHELSVVSEGPEKKRYHSIKVPLYIRKSSFKAVLHCPLQWNMLNVLWPTATTSDQCGQKCALLLSCSRLWRHCVLTHPVHADTMAAWSEDKPLKVSTDIFCGNIHLSFSSPQNK